MSRPDVIIVGHRSALKGKGRTYSIAAPKAKGRKWLRRYFQGPGMNVMGRTFYHVGKRRTAEFIVDVLKSDGLTCAVVEL